MRIDKTEILKLKLKQHGYDSVKKISKALNMNHSTISHALLYDNRSPMLMKKISDLIYLSSSFLLSPFLLLSFLPPLFPLLLLLFFFKA